MSCRPAKSTATGKVILFDGSVHEFDTPITVAELMLEHPQQVVAEFEPAVSKRRVTPLPADKKLEVKQTYLMLPIKPGKQPRLTAEETKRFLLTLNSATRSRSLLLLPKFDSCFAKALCACTAVEGGRGKTKSGIGKNKVDTYISEGHRCNTRRQSNTLLELPETSEVRPAYLHKQLSWDGWKPSLETIEEATGGVERKMSRWLSLQY